MRRLWKRNLENLKIHAIRENWDNLPTDLQDQLIAIGFKLKKK